MEVVQRQTPFQPEIVIVNKTVKCGICTKPIFGGDRAAVISQERAQRLSYVRLDDQTRRGKRTARNFSRSTHRFFHESCI